LRIKIVQVGNDWTATHFLRRLEGDLPEKHNITVRLRVLTGFQSIDHREGSRQRRAVRRQPADKCQVGGRVVEKRFQQPKTIDGAGIEDSEYSR